MQSPLSCKVTYFQILGIRHRYLWWAFILPTTRLGRKGRQTNDLFTNTGSIRNSRIFHQIFLRLNRSKDQCSLGM